MFRMCWAQSEGGWRYRHVSYYRSYDLVTAHQDGPEGNDVAFS